jgi:hypothetical protein
MNDVLWAKESLIGRQSDKKSFADYFFISFHVSFNLSSHHSQQLYHVGICTYANTTKVLEKRCVHFYLYIFDDYRRAGWLGTKAAATNSCQPPVHVAVFCLFVGK